MRANRETDWASRATLASDPDVLGDLLEISLGRRLCQASLIVEDGVLPLAPSKACRSIALRMSSTEYGSVTVTVINRRGSSLR
jgi:hypothetical protein